MVRLPLLAMTTGGYEEDCGDLVFVWKLAQCFRRDTSSILARARLSTKVDLLLLPLLSCLRQLGPKRMLPIYISDVDYNSIHTFLDCRG